MFPQLIAGPIVKYRDVSTQLHVYKHRYNLKQIEEGMTLFTFGLAKKVLLADAIGALWTRHHRRCGQPFHHLCGVWKRLHPAGVAGRHRLLAPAVFRLFSGYSLMGIGMGRMLGFDFPQNFNYPLHLRLHHRILAALAHDPFRLVPGVCVYPTRRQPQGPQAADLQPLRRGAAHRHLARRRLELYLLGSVLLCSAGGCEKLFLLPYLKKGKVWPHFYTLFLVVVGWAMFVGNDTGVSFGLLFQKLFIPSGGVSPLYFLRNYGGVLLAVRVVCCTPLIEKSFGTC